MTALGLPDFGPVQHNVAFNAASRHDPRACTPSRGTSSSRVASGRVLRRVGRPARGRHRSARRHAVELDPGTAVFVPRGVGNGYQTLERRHDLHLPGQRPLAPRRGLPRASTSPTRPLAIAWPIPLAEARDLRARTGPRPRWPTSTPMPPQPAAGPRRGTASSAGRCSAASRAPWPVGPATSSTSPTPTQLDGVAVDRARRGAQRRGLHRRRPRRDRRRAARCLGGQRRRPGAAGPAGAPSTASRWCTTRPTTSSTAPASVHDEDEPLSPLGVYAPDQGRRRRRRRRRAPALPAAHLVGDRRRRQLRAHHGAARRRAASPPTVVADQVGRLTFADELARATRHLLETGAPYGTYHVTNGGPPMSWADVAREVFALRGPRPATTYATSPPRSTPPAARRAHGRGRACCRWPGSRRPASSRRTLVRRCATTAPRACRSRPRGG